MIRFRNNFLLYTNLLLCILLNIYKLYLLLLEKKNDVAAG